MPMTQAVREMVHKELHSAASDGSIARRYSLTLEEVRQEREAIGLARPSYRPVEEYSKLIPARLRPYVVCVKGLHDPWPNDGSERKARADYDAGITEMCTGRYAIDDEPSHDLLALFSIPRSKPIDRDPWFSRRAAS